MIVGRIRDKFIEHIPNLSEKLVVLHWMTKVFNYPKITEEQRKTMDQSGVIKFKTDNDKIIPGSIMAYKLKEGQELFVVKSVEDIYDITNITCEFLCKNNNTRIFDLRDPITINKGDILNFKGPEPIVTTPAYILMNQRLFVEPFGDLIQYRNEAFTSKILNSLYENILNDSLDGKLPAGITININDSNIMDKLRNEEQVVNMVNHAFTNAYSLGQFAELCNKSFTNKSFYVDEKVNELKAKLFNDMTEEDKRNPITIAKIEKVLVDLDKKTLEGDDAKIFHDAMGNSSYETHRKKLFISVGGIPDFDNSKNTYNFITKSLNESYDISKFHVYINENRSGSYKRGKETAKGGEQTKYVLRVYQDFEITEKDCKTNRGMVVELLHNIDRPEVLQYLGCHEAGTNKLIDREYLKSKLGKFIKVRCPEFCSTVGGVCYKCAGYKFEQLNDTKLGTYIVDLSSGMLSVAMAAFHGTKIETLNFCFEDHIYVV